MTREPARDRTHRRLLIRGSIGGPLVFLLLAVLAWHQGASPTATLCGVGAVLLAIGGIAARRGSDLDIQWRVQLIGMLTLVALVAWSLGPLEVSGTVYMAGVLVLVPATVRLSRIELIVIAGAYGVGAFALYAYATIARPAPVLDPAVAHGMWLLLVVSLGAMLTMQLDYLLTERERALHLLELAKDRSERLLRNVLPASVAAELRDGVEHPAESFDAVTVLFADVVGFTTLSATMEPERTVAILNDVFSAFDRFCKEEEVEKIRTIGDGYMACAGAPERRDDHAAAMARVALKMRDHMRDHSDLQVRIGLNSGPATAAIVGTTKFHYDLWGDAVNIAARMESQGEPGRIQIAAGTWERIRDAFTVEERGTIEVKGRGPMKTWWLVESPARRTDAPGAVP